MGYIDQIRSFLPSIEQDDKASVYVSVQHLREIVDFADNAQSFANDTTALLEKAETERKQQDILVAELTKKVSNQNALIVEQQFQLRGLKQLKTQADAGDIAQRELWEISRIVAGDKAYITDKTIVEYVRDAFGELTQKVIDLEARLVEKEGAVIRYYQDEEEKLCVSWNKAAEDELGFERLWSLAKSVGAVIKP